MVPSPPVVVPPVRMCSSNSELSHVTELCKTTLPAMDTVECRTTSLNVNVSTWLLRLTLNALSCGETESLVKALQAAAVAFFTELPIRSCPNV